MSTLGKGKINILLYKEVRICCLKLKISITTKLIEFFILGKLQVCPDGLNISLKILNAEPLVARSVATSEIKICACLLNCLGYTLQT